MGNTTLRNARKIFTGSGGDSSLPNRVLNLENNEYKITYYEIISGASGSITLPTGATINAGEFGLSGNCILSKIDGSNKPTFESPKTSGGTIVTASLDETTGDWVASGTYTDANVALIYSIKVKGINYSNLDYDFIIETIALNKESGDKYMWLDTVNSATLTGSTAETIMSVYQFSAGDYQVGDVIQFQIRGRKTGTTSFHTVRMYYNTSNSLSGATLLHSVQIANTNISFSHIKNGIIKSASETEFYPQGTASDNGVNATTASTNKNIDYTVSGYFIVSVVNNSALDSTVISLFEIQRKRL